MTNQELAQEISTRIGESPIPFDSVYSIALQIYRELGGTENQFDSVYSILMDILPLASETAHLINDNVVALDKTWSSSKIDSELEALAGTANSEIDGKETEDFRFVTELPVSGEEGEQVIIKGDNEDTLYKFVSGEWAIQAPDATKLYFDTENEVLYSYASVEHQFVRISMVNTIVVGSNLNTNADLKALKTVGVYSVVQRLHNATKGDYVKNWTLYVESVDYDEYDKSDSIYQRIQSNYTIQKRTWSATRATNDGWSNFSTYYAGEIKDTTTSKYYTWSSNKIMAELANAGFDVEVVQSLPVSGDVHTIYFVPASTTGETDIYDEYMYVDSSWEKVGSTRIDLSEYAKKMDYFVPINMQTQEFDWSVLNDAVTTGKYRVCFGMEMGGQRIIVGVCDLYVTAMSNDIMQLIAMWGDYSISTIKRMSSNGGTSWREYQRSIPTIDDDDSAPVQLTSTVTYSTSKINQLLAAKQGTLTAGTGIEISGTTISTPALVPTAGWNYATKYIDDDTNLEGTNVATGNYSNWAEGSKTTATSSYGGNHAEGYSTSATGQYGTHSEGAFTSSSGIGSHAEGYDTSATARASHAEGEATLASGQGSHAEGWGSPSHNYPNSAIGSSSHVEGTVTIARNKAEHAEGTHNVSHKASDNMGDSGNTLSSIGFHIGDNWDGVFKNAREIMQNGDMYIYGVGGYQGTNTKVQDATIKTLQEYIASLEARISALENPNA